jgi:hypothetical protein
MLVYYVVVITAILIRNDCANLTKSTRLDLLASGDENSCDLCAGWFPWFDNFPDQPRLANFL